MARNPEYDVTLDGIGLILSRDGLGVSRVQANPYAMKSSSGERTYADLDEWAVFQVSTCHRGMGQERYGDPEQFWYAHGTDTRFKDKIICSPAWQDVDSADMTGASGEDMFFVHFGDKFFCASDDEVFELSSGNWTSRDHVSGEDVTGMVAYNDYLYVARGANSLRKSVDGTTWTDVGGTPAAYHLYVHGGFLYRSALSGSLFYSSDPEDASPTWSTAIVAGSTDYGIQSMCTYQNSLIVFKNDGAWRVPGNPGDLDTAYRVPELDWRSHIHTNNGKYSCVWSDGFLYVSCGDSGLLRWTGRTVTPIGPDTLLANDVIGTLVGLVPTPNFLYTTLANGPGDGVTSFILAWNGSGWHCLKYMIHATPKAIYFFDGELYWGAYTAHTTDHNTVWKIYTPAKTQDPTQDTAYTYQADNYLWLPKFTANLHHTYKEFRSLTFWLDNLGGTATSGAQTVTWAYNVDNNSGSAAAGVLTVKDGGQKTFTVDFDAADFTDKILASVDTDRLVVTLATGHGVSDIDTGDWLYFADINEYRYGHSKTTGPPATLTLQCPLDSTPAANSYIRPGVPVGRYILIKVTLSTADSARTSVVYAVALKYLVNISDYDIWQLNVQVSDPIALRNGMTKRQPIADQLTRLDEIRKKGRVAFVDEVGDSHVVKVTNYSLQPVRQRVDSKMEAETGYTCKLTLLEV